MMQQPMLIAWRPRSIGFWILFDPRIGEPVDDEFVAVDFELAVKNDLMSVLAGDYYIVPKEGAGLRFEYERIGEKKPTADGYEALFQVSDAYLHDAAGERTEDIPDPIVWAILSALKDHQEVGEDGFVQSFVASGGMTRAQLVLRTAVGFSLKDGERIHWKAVGQNLDANSEHRGAASRRAGALWHFHELHFPPAAEGNPGVSAGGMEGPICSNQARATAGLKSQ